MEIMAYIRRWVGALLLAVMTVLGMGAMVATPAMADPVATASPSADPSENPTDGETEPPEPVQPEQQEEEKNTDTYSLYGLASSMASVFANTQNPEALAAKVTGGSSGGGGEGDGGSGEAADGKVGFDIEVWSTTLSGPGSAGSFLAYPDSELSENSGWLFQNYARNAVRPGYDSLVAQFSMPGGQGGSSSLSSHSVKEYAYFGAAVKSLGLDNTTTIVAGGGPGLLKTSMASILSIAYLVSSGIDTVFATAINILQALNPFRLFAKGVASAFGGTGSQAAAIVGSEGQPPAAVASLVNFLGSTYSFVRGMGIFILLPMMIVIALFSFAMMSQRRKSSGARGRIAKDLIVRIVFWAVGIPMMGFAYTGVLDSVEDTLKPQGGTTNVVTSTFVDYGSWATNNRYAIPKSAKIEYDVKSREATVDSQVNVRDTARKINKEAAGIGSDGIKFLDSNKGFVLASDGPAWNPSESVKANRLILDYIKGTTVSADEFASYMQKDATKFALQHKETDKKREYPKLWYSAVRELAKKDKMVSGDGGAVGAPSPGTEVEVPNPEDMEGDELLRHVGIKNNPLINISGQGLIASEGKDTYEFQSYSTGCKGTGARNGRALLNSDKDESPRACNMSPVATYNMLMTDFGGESATVFSGAQTSTTNSTINHHKVNLVGTGAAQELYLANSMVSLASIAFLGILFAGAMIIGSFKRYGPLIFSVIGSQLGLVGIMGRLIGYTVALILEVLVTLGIYVMVQELIIALPKLIESPITALTKNVGNASGSSMITGGFAAAGGSSTTGAHMLGIGFIIVIQILFFMTALKSRAKVLNAANAAIDSLLSKLLGARVSTAGSGTAGTAGAAVGGAGLLAAGAMGGGGGLLGSPSAADGAVLGEGQQAGPEAADNAQGGGVMEAGPIGMDTSESDAAGNESFNANPGEQDAQGLNTDDASSDAEQDANAAGLQDENAAALAGGDVSGQADDAKAQAADADAQMSQGADSDADSVGGAMVRDAQREGTAAETQDANASGGVGLQADGSMVDKAGATTAAFAPGEHGGPAEAAAQENAENRALQSQEAQKALAGAEGSGISAEGAQAAGVDHPSQTASFDAAAGPLGESMAASADRAQVQGMDATGATGGESLDSATGTSGVGQMGADGSVSEESQLGSGHDAQSSQTGQQGISDDGSRVSTISDAQPVAPQGFETGESAVEVQGAESITGTAHGVQPMGDSQFASPDSQADQIAAARIAEQTEALHESFFSGGMAASLGDMGSLLKENMSVITSQMRGDNTGE